MSRQRSMEVIRHSEYVTIGELVPLTGARYSTLKFYTEEGMLPFEQTEENLTRRYPREKSTERIAQIQALRQSKKKHSGNQENIGLLLKPGKLCPHRPLIPRTLIILHTKPPNTSPPAPLPGYGVKCPPFHPPI